MVSKKVGGVIMVMLAMVVLITTLEPVLALRPVHEPLFNIMLSEMSKGVDTTAGGLNWPSWWPDWLIPPCAMYNAPCGFLVSCCLGCECLPYRIDFRYIEKRCSTLSLDAKVPCLGTET